MSVIITPVINDYIYEHIAEWKIEKLTCAENMISETPKFSLTPLTADIEFYLEVQCSSDLKLTLIRIPGTKNIPPLKMKVALTAHKMNGDHFMKFVSSSSINVSEFTKLDIIHKGQGDSYGHKKLLFSGFLDLVVKCRMIFFEFSFIRPIACKKEKISVNKYGRQEKNQVQDDEILGEKHSVFGDVEFKIGDTRDGDLTSFTAHRTVFNDHSPGLLKKLEENFVHKWSGIDCSVFDCFLNYLYSREIKDKSWDTVKGLYVMAVDCEMKVLIQDCVAIVLSFLSIEKVCDIFHLVYSHENRNSLIKKELNDFAAVHFKELFRTSEWKQLVVKYPIIGCDVMEIFLKKV